jgi:hypothetical protein
VRETARAVLVPLAIALAVGAALAWPAWAWGGREGLAALGVAAAIGWLGAAVGHALRAWLARRLSGPGAAVSAVQAGMAARVLLTAFLALPFFLLDVFARVPFATWLVLHYLAQLVLEVFVSVRELGQNPGPPASGGDGAA